MAQPVGRLTLSWTDLEKRLVILERGRRDTSFLNLKFCQEFEDRLTVLEQDRSRGSCQGPEGDISTQDIRGKAKDFAEHTTFHGLTNVGICM